MAMVSWFGILLTVAGLAVSQRTTKNALQAATMAKADLQETLGRERRDSYFHRIALAHRELSVDNLHGALKLLEECPEDLREWEWHYLMRLCRIEPLVLRDKTEVQRRGVQPGRRTTRLRGRGRDRQDLEQQDGRPWSRPSPRTPMQSSASRSTPTASTWPPAART